MGNKLIVQAILIVTAIVIIVSYVKPAFAKISDIQDDIAQYRSTVNKASELNAALQQLISVEQSLSGREVRNLETYLPSNVNDVVVMRDIENIFKVANATMMSLSAVSSDSYQQPIMSPNSDSGAVVEGNQDPVLVYKDFQVEFYGSYDELKAVLAAMEANSYTLEVVELAFSSPASNAEELLDFGLSADTMVYSLTVRAFALPTSK
jgi:hypothetical protein